MNVPTHGQATVLFRLAGPMQAWSRQRRTHGVKGRRPTQDHPTKTGVIGLVANAMGRDRADPVDDLAGLRFAVRADRAGRVETDYHTAGGGTMPLTALETALAGSPAYGAASGVKTGRDGRLTSSPSPNPVVTVDEYLADANFTVALSGPVEVVQAVHDALAAPARPLFLGRAGYPPAGPIWVEVTADTDPAEAVLSPLLDERHDQIVHVWWETSDPADGGIPVHDQPVDYLDRRAGWRLEAHQATTLDEPADAGSFDPFTPPTESGQS